MCTIFLISQEFGLFLKQIVSFIIAHTNQRKRNVQTKTHKTKPAYKTLIKAFHSKIFRRFTSPNIISKERRSKPTKISNLHVYTPLRRKFSDLHLILGNLWAMKDNMKESVPIVMLMPVLHIHI